MTDDARYELVSDAIYRALVVYDREKRNVRDPRSAIGSRPGRVKGPTIKRGTGRSGLTRHLTAAVLRALDEVSA
jgi:hypothetical protein